MKELIVGKTYTTNELQKFFSVSASTWSHKRNEYLDNLSLYYEYEVKYRGRNTDYLIVKKFVRVLSFQPKSSLLITPRL